MAERDRARPVTQRRFEDVVEPPSAEHLTPSGGASEEPVPSPPSEPIPRTPCDQELRARQLKWLLERERAVPSQPPAGEEAPT